MNAARWRETLRTVFGFDGFRPGQEEIVAAVLGGEDVLAVMPTGSGKSLTYQLPGIVDGGLTVVVSPLIALMRDQVHQLAGFGVTAATLNSTSEDEATRAAWAGMRDGSLRFLFVSPERLAIDGFVDALGAVGVRRLVIDEAHCISQWGHDFRPEYRGLARVRERLGGPPVLALTATADAATRADIAAQLFPKRKPKQFLHSFDRPNLSLRFEPKIETRQQLADFLDGRHGESGIVYASSRDKTEKLAARLRQLGHRSLAYHAGLDAGLRTRNQDAFLTEDGVVMVATVAFGMGINKPDIRFVAHADMPASVEAWYQEIGRAGRDGLPADTLTLYGGADMALRRRQLADKELSPEQRRIEEKRLAAIISLCESALCRRRSFLAYFGEDAPPACGHCDLCEGGAAVYDGTIDAQKVLSAVVRTGQRFGAMHLSDILIGEASPNVVRHGHDQLKTFGVGSDRARKEWQATIRQLFAGGFLAEAGDHGGYRMTPEGEEILRGRQSIQLRVPPPVRGRRERRAPAAAMEGLDAATADLLVHLKETRLALARAEGIAAFMVFPDRTLIEMARQKPRSADALRTLHGVGEAKLARYGEAFLAAIAASAAK
jgi:ATP-dependent DNA helicase RecQ